MQLKSLSILSALLLPLITGCSTRATTSSDSDFVEIDVRSLMSLPIEEFDYFSNPAIAEVEYFQPHDTIIVPFGGWQLGDSWLSVDSHGIMVIDKTSGKVVSDFTKKGGGPEEYVNIFEESK